MNNKVKLGIVGLGARGLALLENCYLDHPEVDFVAVCDLYEDRQEKASQVIFEKSGKKPATFCNASELMDQAKPDAIVICTSWNNHIDLCIEAMNRGIAVGCEVGGAYSVRECWKLVEAYERTKTPIMMLENCIYGRDEMMVHNMVKQGLLGTIIHCEGGYKHDLREEIVFGRQNRHYRLNNYLHRNAENYPTHELGPISKILDINKGNRMLTICSVSSASVGLQEFCLNKDDLDKDIKNLNFVQGDVVTSIIKCARGETITLTLDTTLPRYYSRGFTVQGTKGMYTEDNKSVFLDTLANAEYHFNWDKKWGNVEEYREDYEHDVWKKYLLDGIKPGHDGMDYLVLCDFVDMIKGRIESPVDVYDMASMMCISVLSEESIAKGGAPVYIPDFTNGRWINY